MNGRIDGLVGSGLPRELNGPSTVQDCATSTDGRRPLLLVNDLHLADDLRGHAFKPCRAHQVLDTVNATVLLCGAALVLSAPRRRHWSQRLEAVALAA